jgi:hypothetical protein
MAEVEVDVWVRATGQTATIRLPDVSAEARQWSDDDAARLLTGMLRAIERTQNPDGEMPPITLRGFSWIVNPVDDGNVVVALEMPMGAAIAGPFAIDEARLTALIERAMAVRPAGSSPPTVH